MFLAADDDASWGALAAVSANGIGADERFATAEGRREHDAALTEALEAMFALRDADEWERELIAAGVGCVNASEYDSPGAFLVQDEHAQANGLLSEAHHALWGDYRRWGPPSTFSGTPGNPRAGVLAGQHTDELLAEAGYSPSEIGQLRSANVVWSEVPMELPEPATVA